MCAVTCAVASATCCCLRSCWVGKPVRGWLVWRFHATKMQAKRKRSDETVLTPKCPLKKLSGHLAVVGDVPGQQFLNAADGMIRNAGQHFPQVSFGIEVI